MEYANFNAAAFDPKPLIRAFEAARAQLNSLSDDLEGRENELSAAVRRAETQHFQNTQTLGTKLGQTIASFNRLDSTLNGPIGDGGDIDGGGSAALRIGERLEDLERQRQRAQDAKFLIQCWLEVSERGHLSTLEDLKRSPGDGKLRSASIARQLLKICHRLDPDVAPQVNGNGRTNGTKGIEDRNGPTATNKFPAREIIEKFLEGLETDLLNEFDSHYRRQNLEGMKVCSSSQLKSSLNNTSCRSVLQLFVISTMAPV
jgi:hypothetical protein